MTHCHTPEDVNLQQHYCENLQSHRKHLAAPLQKTDRSAKWYLLHCLQIKPTVKNV